MADVKVRFTAEERGGGTVEALNKRLAGFNRGLAETRAPFDRLAANYARFTALTGADKVAGGLANVARTGFSAFQSASRIIEPLGAIAGAASIAGLFRLATAWAGFGTQLGNTAARAGLSAEQLHRLENAGRLAGVSAEAVAGGMTALRDNMVNAMSGKAPQVVGMMQALGLSVDDARRFAGDTTRALPELADKIAALHDPTLQAQAATALFGGAGEQLLPFLKRGSAGIADYTERAGRYGLVNAEGVAAANRLREAQVSLSLAVEGVGNAVAQQLAPVIGPLLTQLADWIAANRDWIAQGIGEKVKVVADFLSSTDWARIGGTIQSVAHGAEAVVEAFGGWEKAGLGVLAFFAVAWLAKMMVPLLAVTRLLRRMPLDAAAAKAGPGGAPAQGGAASAARLAGQVAIADQIVTAVDSNDATGAWIDKHVPGASWLDNAASHIGLGRSYEEQKRVEGILHPTGGGPRAPGPAMASAAVPGSGGAITPSAGGGATQGGKSDATQWGKDLTQLMSKGWSKAQASGILGNLDQESGGDASARGDGGHAYGLAQWHEDRQATFKEQFGHDIQHSTHAEQLDFVDWELRNTEASAGKHIAATTTARQAAAAGRRYYERPRDADGYEDGWRGDKAERIAATAAPPSGPDRVLAANAGTAANPGAAPPGGQITPTVRVVGAPAGTTVIASSSGGALAPVNIQRTQTAVN